MLMKLTGFVLIILCGGSAGLYISKRIGEKTEFISQYISFLTQAEAMITFAGSDIRYILNNVKSIPLMDHMINDTLDYLNNNYDFCSAWEKSVHAAYSRKEFEKEDLSLLLAFGVGFGEQGTDEEILKIKLNISNVSERLKIRKNDNETKMKLYKTLGTFSGAIIAVLLV